MHSTTTPLLPQWSPRRSTFYKRTRAARCRPPSRPACPWEGSLGRVSRGVAGGHQGIRKARRATAAPERHPAQVWGCAPERRRVSASRRAVSAGHFFGGWTVGMDLLFGGCRQHQARATGRRMKWIEQFKDVAPLRARLAADPAFASLRDLPRFREIAGEQVR